MTLENVRGYVKMIPGEAYRLSKGAQILNTAYKGIVVGTGIDILSSTIGEKTSGFFKINDLGNTGFFRRSFDAFFGGSATENALNDLAHQRDIVYDKTLKQYNRVRDWYRKNCR